MTALPINLPDGFTSKVNVDDNVSIGQIVASRESVSEQLINIPKELSVKRSQVKKVIQKIPGEAVSKGDIIAIKKNFFGTKSTVLRSSLSGTVVRYERDSGNLVIKTSLGTTGENIISPVEGRVSLCNNTTITIDTDKSVLVGEDGTGGVGQGEVIVLKEDQPFFLDSHSIGKIVIGKNFTREMLLKGIGIGVAGMVGGEIEKDDIEYLSKKKFDTPIIKLGEEDMRKIAEWRDKKVYMDGETKSIIFLHL